MVCFCPRGVRQAGCHRKVAGDLPKKSGGAGAQHESRIVIHPAVQVRGTKVSQKAPPLRAGRDGAGRQQCPPCDSAGIVDFFLGLYSYFVKQ